MSVRAPDAPVDVVETTALTKDYGGGIGIRELSLSVRKGEIFGFLGPNGAGKTTTLRTLLGFLKPTRGTARVLGLDVVRDSAEIRRRTGYLPSEARLYPHLKGREVVDWALQARGIAGGGRVEALADRLGLDLPFKVKNGSRECVGRFPSSRRWPMRQK